MKPFNFIKSIILLIVLFLASSKNFLLYGRTLNDIVSTNSFNVAVLNPEMNSFDPNLDRKINNIIKNNFEEYTKINLNKKININFYYVDHVSDFWINKNLLNKVDAYFELMSINDFRKKIATPIKILNTKYDFVCNFDFKYDKNITGEDIIEKILYTSNIKFIGLKNSYLYNLMQIYNIPINRINYVNSIRNIIDKMSDNKTQEYFCSVLETTNILYLLTKSNIFFITHMPHSGNNELAWWVENNNIEIFNFVKHFNEYLQKNNGLDKILLTLFGINYNFYNYFINSSSQTISNE